MYIPTRVNGSGEGDHAQAVLDGIAGKPLLPGVRFGGAPSSEKPNEVPAHKAAAQAQAARPRITWPSTPYAPLGVAPVTPVIPTPTTTNTPLYKQPLFWIATLGGLAVLGGLIALAVHLDRDRTDVERRSRAFARALGARGGERDFDDDDNDDVIDAEYTEVR